MIEFDMPAHATGFCKGRPEICDTYCKGTFSPATNATFEFIDKFFDDVISMFPDLVLHLGGDEFNNDCWLKDPIISSWMNS
jgi:hexosaminidase